MTRDTLWLPTATVYTTHDRGGRPHVCPASARLATDAAFAARVEARREWRESMATGMSEENRKKVTGYR
jgi:hypothetical protein